MEVAAWLDIPLEVRNRIMWDMRNLGLLSKEFVSAYEAKRDVWPRPEKRIPRIGDVEPDRKWFEGVARKDLVSVGKAGMARLESWLGRELAHKKGSKRKYKRVVEQATLDKAQALLERHGYIVTAPKK